MGQSHFGIASSQVIERPTCSKCGNRMMLARIEPYKPNHDKRTFECFDCDHVESMVVKIQVGPPSGIEGLTALPATQRPYKLSLNPAAAGEKTSGKIST